MHQTECPGYNELKVTEENGIFIRLIIIEIFITVLLETTVILINTCTST